MSGGGERWKLYTAGAGIDLQTVITLKYTLVSFFRTFPPAASLTSNLVAQMVEIPKRNSKC